MTSNATATGVPHETAKKRKAPPSANEIFTDPVPVTDTTNYNGDRVQNSTKKVYVGQSKKVWLLFGFAGLTRCAGVSGGRIDAACLCCNTYFVGVFYEIVSNWKE
jgi:hypothetical protein